METNDLFRRLPKLYNFATFSIKILCLFHSIHADNLGKQKNAINKISRKIKGVKREKSAGDRRQRICRT
jgi:hypothetical protein